MQAHHTAEAAHYRSQRTINTRHAPEVQYWASEFRVPPAKLIDVVREVGRNLGEIRRRLET